jgi:hypothetical protein
MATISNTSFFSPTQIAGCALWLDAADANSVTQSGGNVSVWRDKSSNNYTVNQSNALYQPILTSSGIQFNSNSPSYFNTTYTSFPQSETIFIVCNNITNASAEQTLLQTTSIGGRQFYLLNNNILYTAKYGQTLLLASGTVTTNVTRLVESTNNGSSIFHYINGSNVGSNTSITPYSGTGNTTIGALAPNTRGLNGFIYEIIIYNSVLPTAQRQQIEGYLAWKWNLQASLPTTHPYYNNPMIPNLSLSAPLANPLTTVNTTLITMNPTQISGCALWLDAADANTITLTGSNITNVRDKSGQNVVLSNATGFTYSNLFNGSFPSFYNPNGGRNAINPTARLGVNASFGVTVPFTIFFAGIETGISTSNYGYVCDSAPGGVNRPYILASNLQTQFGAGGGVSPVKVPFQACAQYYISGGAMIVNGSNYYTQAVGLSAFTTGGITIGNRLSLDESWPGHLCEIIIYNKPVPISERQQIEGYLAWKWGTQSNLPRSHPYYFNPLIPNLVLQSQLLSMTPSFSPLRFSGTSLWLDAADSSSVITSGGIVSAWRDKTSAYVGTAVPTTTIQYVSNALNGLPVIRISTASYFTFGNINDISTQEFNIFAVVNTSSNTAIPGAIIGKGTGSTGWWFGSSGSTPLQTQYGGNNIYTNTASTNYRIVSSMNPRTSATTHYANGTSLGGVGNGTSSISNASDLRIGSQGNNYTINNTDFAEVILYRGPMTVAQRQQIEGYLAWKWGLQSNLPANHPYVLFPPS